jgi:23S rRNA pseudouridine1911/1915/1917 synthase
MIRDGFVQVNGENQRSSYKLTGGERISLYIEETQNERDHLIPESIPLDIIYEDEEIIGINKPAGLVVHPGVGNKSGTLVNGLIYHFQTLSTLNGELRPGIVHRLDKDTSGVMIIAKTDRAHAYISKQFETKTVQKKYMGITWGIWQDKEGKIETKLFRKKSDPTLFEVHSDKGKTSVTHYKVLEEGRYYSLVNYMPKTGRTHQIRVHSAYQNHPILGDKKYGGGITKIKGFIPEVGKILKIELERLNRHALYSETICIQHPKTKSDIEIHAPLPNELNLILGSLKENNL